MRRMKSWRPSRRTRGGDRGIEGFGLRAARSSDEPAGGLLVGAMVIRMAVSPSELRERLRHVRWIGGTPGGCKSTIARRLANRHDLQLYTVEPSRSSWIAPRRMRLRLSCLPVDGHGRKVAASLPAGDVRDLPRIPRGGLRPHRGGSVGDAGRPSDPRRRVQAAAACGFATPERYSPGRLAPAHRRVPSQGLRFARIHGDTQQDERSGAEPRQPGGPRRALHAGALSRGRAPGPADA